VRSFRHVSGRGPLTVQLAGGGHPRLRLPDGRVFWLSRTAIPPPASGTAKGLLSSTSSVGDSRAMLYKSQVITMRRSCGTGTPSGLLDKHTSCARSIRSRHLLNNFGSSASLNRRRTSAFHRSCSSAAPRLPKGLRKTSKTIAAFMVPSHKPPRSPYRFLPQSAPLAISIETKERRARRACAAERKQPAILTSLTACSRLPRQRQRRCILITINSTIFDMLWNVMDRRGFNCVGGGGAERQNGQVETI